MNASINACFASVQHSDFHFEKWRDEAVELDILNISRCVMICEEFPTEYNTEIDKFLSQRLT